MMQNTGKRLLGGLGITILLGGVVQADSGPEHRVRQPRPILLGTSGGSIDDADRRYCCGGTLGGVVEDTSGTQYIVSNNHVLGRTNRASSGEDTVQPARIDTNCAQIPGDAVADFTEYVPISFSGPNLVDAAIAEVRSGMVSTSGEILDVGVPSTSIRSVTANDVGLSVQKSGRTTGRTTGTIDAIDVTVNVQYPRRCGDRRGDTAQMTGQIRVTPGSFLGSGDSGSLLMENVGSSPRAIGLLFAGSSSSAIANRIENVLCEFSMPLSMAGGTPACGGGCTTNGDCASGEICCDSACVVAACNDNADCDDGDSCTTDACNGAGLCDAACSNEAPACGLADGCCGPGCDSGNDPDCPPAGGCGDGVCAGNANGEDCTTCPDDCACVGGPTCKNGCCGDGQCTGVEKPNSCPVDCGGGAGASARGGFATAAEASTVKRRFSDQLFAIPDVVGHGVGIAIDGSAVIEVYLQRENASSRARIQGRLQGVPTRVVVTGPFVAY